MRSGAAHCMSCLRWLNLRSSPEEMGHWMGEMGRSVGFCLLHTTVASFMEFFPITCEVIAPL